MRFNLLRQEPRDALFSLSMLFIFALAILNCLVLSSASNAAPVMFAYDSNYYRETSQYIVKALQSGGHFGGFSDSFVVHLNRDGPILPGVFAVLACLTGHNMTVADAPFVAAVQSLMYAASAVMVGLASLNLTRNRASAFIASALFLAYPPFCIATIRFLNETAAVFFVSAFLYFATLDRIGFIQKVGLSVSIASLSLIKIIMAPILMLPLLCSALARQRGGAQFKSLWKNEFANAAVVLFGAGLLILPWTILMHQLTGKIIFTADREPALNFLLGMDIETRGVPVIFAGPFFKICFDYSQPTASAVGVYLSRPMEYLKLFVWKIQADFNFPWNDFQHRFLNFSAMQQCVWHWCMLVLSFLGMRFALSPALTKLKQIDLNLLSVVLFVLAHAIWALVATNNRYVVTAFPGVILLAAYAIHRVMAALLSVEYSLQARQIALNQLTRNCLWTAGVVAIWCLTFSVLSPDTRERAVQIAAGDKLERQLKLSGDFEKSGLNMALLIVDAGAVNADLEASVNGVKLPGEFSPLNNFSSTEYSHVAIAEIEIASSRSNQPGPECMRTWKALSVPIELLRGGEVKIELTQKHSATTIFADAEMNERRFPSLFLFGDEEFWRDPFKLDGRPDAPELAANVSDKWTWIHQAKQIPLNVRPRVKLLLTARDSPASVDENWVSPLVVDFTDDTFSKSPGFLLAVGIKTTPPVVMHEFNGKFQPVKIDVSGDARSLSRFSSASVKVTAIYDHKVGAVVPLEGHIDCDRHWQHFTLSGTLTRKQDVTEFRRVVLELFPADWRLREDFPDLENGATQFRNLKVKITPLKIEPSNFERRVVI